ncbi:MAG: hypothetical protein WA510_10265, partial [Acidobacteriaceae bacterium]
MKLANATNLNRKSGVAKWRDLQFASWKNSFSPYPQNCHLDRSEASGEICGLLQPKTALPY